MKLLILGCSDLQIGFVKHLLSNNWDLIVVDKNIDKLKKHKIKNCFKRSVTDKNSVLEISKKSQISGLIPMNDFAMETASYVTSRLNLVGHDYKSALALTRKSIQKNIMVDNGIRTGSFHALEEESDLKDIEVDLGYPVVVKPDFAGGGSRGVAIARNRNELKDAFYEAKSVSFTNLVVVEKFIEGVEISLEILSWRGDHHILAAGKEECYPLRSRVARNFEYQYPTLSDYEVEIIEQLLDAIGHENGLAEVELIRETRTGNISIIEVCGRGGGGHIVHPICDYVSGVDAAQCSALIATGQDLVIRPKKNRQSVVWRFLAAPEGVFKGLSGLSEAEKVPGVISVDIFKQPGDRIGPLKSGLDRTGVILTIGSSIEKAKASADRAETLLKFHN